MELTYGVEIETIGVNQEKTARCIQTVVGGRVYYGNDSYGSWIVEMADGRKWKCMRDGSLSSSTQAEIVTPILKGDADLETLQTVIRAVRANGSKCDSSCGIHVHVGANAFTPAALRNLTKIMNKQEELIYAALKVLPTRADRWARRVEPSFLRAIESKKDLSLDDLNRMWYGRENRHPEHYDSSRYHGLNLHNVWFRGTVEFRLFNGTLHAGKVKAYVQFCLALAQKAIAAKSAQSDKRVFNPATAKYDFRVFLLSLGMIGPKFETARLHLLSNFEGQSAWKNTRRAA